jgi:hypothetical protein
MKFLSDLNLVKKARLINPLFELDPVLDTKTQFGYDGLANRLKIHDGISGRTVIQENDISVDLDFNVDPLLLTDRATIKSLIDTSILSGSGVIGEAEDSTYEDGLFVDFNPNTPVGTAVDRFNEVLKSLAPQPAPSLSNISIQDQGVTGRLSFGSSFNNISYANVDASAGPGASTVNANSIFDTTGTRAGIFNASTIINGVLADSVTANSNGSYPNNSFGNGDQGNLEIYVNGSLAHSVDLSVFSSGGSNNANGTGFSLSAPTNVQFLNGDPFNVFKYRTGTWQVGTADQRPGYNFVEIRHDLGSAVNSTNFFEWVVDDSTAATTLGTGTLDQYASTGTKTLSGVEYDTGATVAYSVTVSNLHRNTYSSASNAIQIQGTNLNSINLTLGNISSETDQEVITNQSLNVTPAGGRLLDQSVSAQVRVLRTVQATQVDGLASIDNLLFDNVSPNSTTLFEDFNDERYRIQSDENFNTTTAAVFESWDTAESLIGLNTGYNNGLQTVSGSLVYPSVDYSSIANGPAGNPNYTTATGERVYYRYFNTGSSTSILTLRINGASVNVINADASFTTTSQAKVELKIPGDTGWMDANKTTQVGATGDGDGCNQSGTFQINTNEIIDFSSGNTGNSTPSANIFYIRITVPVDWIGSLDSITVTV